MKHPIKYFGLVIIPFVTFLLGWNIAVTQIQKNYQEFTSRGVKSESSFFKQFLSQEKNKKDPFAKKELSAKDLGLLFKVWAILDNDYVDSKKLNIQNIVYGAIKGMVNSLNDPYTSFLTPEETKEFQDSLQGKLEGIGAELTVKNKHLTVVSPLKNSPAAKAGILPGDIIYKINDEITSEMTLEQAVMKIRGKKGTEVRLTLIRENKEKPFEVKITRDTLKIESVSYKIKNGKFAYISINQFGDSTIKEWNKIISKVLLASPQGIVLDLRYNGGGYLDAAVAIVSDFIGEGKVVTIKRRRPQENEIQTVSGNPHIPSLPLAVLINKGSASASEIVAGAIQDYARGVIIGEQSFGKGTVQEVVGLNDGSSLRYTIAKWYTPKDRDISDVGITPDKKIKKTNKDFEQDKDPQLDAAIQYLKELKK